MIKFKQCYKFFKQILIDMICEIKVFKNINK